MHGGAVMAFALPGEGRASVFGPAAPPLELEPPLSPEEDEEEEDIVTTHGGTMIRCRSLFCGITSWFWVCAEVCCWLWLCATPLPPGLRRTVPAPVEPWLCPSMHGWIATVWAAEPFGSVTSFEPGGVAVLPGLVWAPEHGGTTIVMALRCLGTMTVRTPGAMRAIWIGLTGIALPPPPPPEPLLPHPLARLASAASTVAAPRLRALPPTLAMPLLFRRRDSAQTAPRAAPSPRRGQYTDIDGRAGRALVGCAAGMSAAPPSLLGRGARVLARNAGGLHVRHGGLLAVLVAGAALRGLFMAAWQPAFMGWPDAKSYLDAAHGVLFASTLRPAGYPIFLHLIDAVVPSITAIVVVNHLLGLGTAVLLYLALIRVGAPSRVALVPAAVAALGGDAVFLEHSPLSEPLFIFLIALGLYAAVRTLRSASLGWPALAGAALAACSTVRVVGVVLLPIAVLWLLLAAHGPLRRRLAAAGITAAAALALLGAYGVAEYRTVGDVGLSRHGAWHIYGRVAPFADCSKFRPPAGTGPLCESTPRARRPYTDSYIFNWWFSPAIRTYGYAYASSPAGTAKIEAFALTAIVHQPLDYLSEVGAGMLRYVTPGSLRGVGGGPTYSELVGPRILFNPFFEYDGLGSVRAYYGWRARSFHARNGLLGVLRGYESATRVDGALMVVLALLSLLAPLVTRGPAQRAALLFTLVAWALLAVPVATLEFSARTGVPGFGALGAAAALGGWGCFGAARRRWSVGRGAFRRPPDRAPAHP